MSSLRASVMVVGAVSLGLAVIGPSTAAVPTEPVKPTPASRGSAGQVVTAAPDSGRIAFTTRKGKLSVMDADGRHVRRLVDFGRSWSPVWSPDGRRIAFNNFDGGSWDGSWDAWVVAANTGRARRLTDSSTRSSGPSWSPDGRKIAYASQTDTNVDAIFVMDADGTNRRLVTGSPAVVGATTTVWSPNGRWIAFSGSYYPDNDWESVLGVVRPDGTKARQLASCYPDCEHTDAVWSPDGRQVAWSPDSSGVEVFDPRRGMVFEAVGSDPVWSPNGRRIAFSRDGRLWVMRADGTKARRTLAQGEPVDWSPNGRRLLIRQWSEAKGYSVMKVVRPNGRQVRTLREGYGADWFGAAPTRTTVDAAPEPVARGKPLAVSGKVTKVGIGLYGATVKIRFKAAGARRYTTVRTTTADAMGRFKTTVTAHTSGTWKAVHPATAATLTSKATDSVKVRR